MPIFYTCLFYWCFRACVFSLNSLQWLPQDLEQMGSRDGAVVRALASHKCGPDSIPARYHKWVAPWIFVRVLLFLSPPATTKTNNFKFQFEQDRGPT